MRDPDPLPQELRAEPNGELNLPANLPVWAEVSLEGSAASDEANTVAPSLEHRRAEFIAKYGIRVIEDHSSQVGVTIPNNVKHSEFLNEAQELSIALREANGALYWAHQAISPAELQLWLADPTFQAKGSGKEVVTDGCVPGSSGLGMTRGGQEEFLAKRGLSMEQIRELVVAHTARYILDGQSIFKGKLVRAVGVGLDFNANGLYVNNIPDNASHDYLSVAARLAA
jgi:hypothetical protein